MKKGERVLKLLIVKNEMLKEKLFRISLSLLMKMMRLLFGNMKIHISRNTKKS